MTLTGVEGQATGRVAEPGEAAGIVARSPESSKLRSRHDFAKLDVLTLFGQGHGTITLNDIKLVGCVTGALALKQLAEHILIELLLAFYVFNT